MEVRITKLPQLFERPVQYQMPPSQRPYVWNLERNWEPLWDDIRTIADRCLTENDDAKHFFGAVVLHQSRTRTGTVDRPAVIDGQQRITTFQVLLKSASELFEKNGQTSAAGRIRSYIENNKDFHTKEDDLLKVWPTETDRDAFKEVLSPAYSNWKNKDKLIVQAKEFFLSKMEEWVMLTKQSVGGDEIEHQTLGALEEALIDRIELVSIDVDENDDPHVIFETLNARGTSLLESDLVKNEIMREAGVRVNDEAGEYWAFEDDWWRSQDISDDKNSSRQSRIDTFLKHWIISCQKKDVKQLDVFEEFKAFRQRVPNLSIAEVAFDIASIGKVYRSLEAPDDPTLETSRRYRRIVTMSSNAVIPVLLRLHDSNVSSTSRERALKALDSYLVRRQFCGRRQNSGTDFQAYMMNMLQAIENSPPECADISVVDFLQTRTVAHSDESPAWPRDDEFRESFIGSAIYTRMGAKRVSSVLEEIEMQLRDNPKTESLAFNLGTLTVEHIIPQKWEDNWYSLVLERDSDAGNLFEVTDIEGEIDQLREQLTSIAEYAREFPEDSPDELMASSEFSLAYSSGEIQEIVEATRGGRSPENLIERYLTRRRNELIEQEQLDVSTMLERERRLDRGLNYIVHTIGNLTLVTRPLNQELANDRWHVKRDALQEHSSLYLNRELLAQVSREQTWNERQAEQRAERLFAIARELWPSSP